MGRIFPEEHVYGYPRRVKVFVFVTPILVTALCWWVLSGSVTTGVRVTMALIWLSAMAQAVLGFQNPFHFTIGNESVSVEYLGGVTRTWSLHDLRVAENPGLVSLISGAYEIRDQSGAVAFRIWDKLSRLNEFLDYVRGNSARS